MIIRNHGYKLKIIDLFCGCGGFTAGVIEAAINHKFDPEISLAIDNDVAATDVYEMNFKQYINKLLNIDIIDLFSSSLNAPYSTNENKLKKELTDIDVLVAGPPCQGHSDLNNKTLRNDPRNQLYLSVIRAIGLLKPKIVAIENVTSIIHDKLQVVQNSIKYLQKIGYRIETIEINATDFGIAQKRKRHLLIGYNFPLPYSVEKQLLKRENERQLH